MRQRLISYARWKTTRSITLTADSPFAGFYAGHFNIWGIDYLLAIWISATGWTMRISLSVTCIFGTSMERVNFRFAGTPEAENRVKTPATVACYHANFPVRCSLDCLQAALIY